MTDVLAHRKNTLPARDGVGADDRMHGLQGASNIVRGASRFVVDLEAAAFCRLVEVGLRKRAREALKQLLDRRRDAVIYLISRSPQCVCITQLSASSGQTEETDRKRTSASLRKLRQSQAGVVRGHRLKGDIRMP